MKIAISPAALTLLVLFLNCLWGSPGAAGAMPDTAQGGKPYSGKGLFPRQLRCEYLANPEGIDEKAPRLSWVVESGERDQRQTAWHILVAASEKLLKQDRGDLWDSGKVNGAETVGTVYAGRGLSSHQQCFWKVKVWDKNGRESGWSEPARWSMGLLGEGDWKAEWIGYDKPRQKPVVVPALADAKWIWHAADPAGKVPKCERLFIGSIRLPDVKIKQAQLLAAGDDALTVAVNGERVLSTSAQGESWRKVNVTDVAGPLRGGENEFRVLVRNEKESPAGLIAKISITTEDGQSISRTTDGTWKTTDQPGNDWMKRPMDSSGWPAAAVVAAYGAEPWGKLGVAEIVLPPATLLRHEFAVEKAVKRAVLYASALGLVDMHLNGCRVSEEYFTPGWTDYPKRVYYRAWDVTPLMHKGDNALGAVLADGWFSGYVGYGKARDLYGKLPRVRAQLHLEFADGTSAEIGTGSDWQAAVGATLEADFLKGETCDARLERAGWDKPGGGKGIWDAVVAGMTELHPVVQAHPGPPVRAIEEFAPQSITEPKPGVYVLDLGQNFAGVARLKLRGQPGQKVVLRFAERLNPDGTIYTVNLRSARATDTYICKGKGVETWQPRFTFHGFQYIEVTGLGEKPGRDTITGVALSSDTPVAGEFACSDPMLNRLHQNIYWTQRANFIDVPTDCPQRDERLGWTGDAQVYVRTATLNTDVQAFFKKWLVDLDEDGQRADGQFPCVAPVKVAENDGGPAWADAGVICPWTIYSVYGDRRALERHFDAMTRFVEFCRQRSTPELLPPAKFHCFGDWLSIKAETPKDVIYTAYFAYSTHLTARTAEVLGKTEAAAKYRDLFEKIRAAFNQAYVGPDGRIKGNTQCVYVLALAFDLVQGERAAQAARYLVADIEERGWHLSTGFIGTKDLMLVLSKIGRTDVALRLLHNETFPSWGFSIKHGATSIWERWDGWTPEKGFQDPGMNSFAHYSFGAVYQWMVENLGGIQSVQPAYQELVIAPTLDEKLDWARVAYRSIRGPIVSEWKRGKGTTELKVTVPANTTAMVAVPGASADAITESGKPLAQAKAVKFVRSEGKTVWVRVGSGTYSFQSKL